MTETKKIVTWSELSRKIQKYRKNRKKIVFTNGCFDVVHVGHLKVIEWSKRQGDILIVAINSDASTRRLKGPKRPIVSENERAQLLAGFHAVDFVTVFDQDTPAKLISLVKPDVLVKGGDWAKSEIVGADVAKKVVRVPLVKGRSTTNLIERILTAYGGR